MQCTRPLCHIHKKKKTCKLQGKQMKTLCHHLGQCSPPIKLISIYALSELSAHVEHTQLAGGSAENAQPGQVGNGKCLPQTPKCVRQHSCGGACYIIKGLPRGDKSVKIRRETNYKINQQCRANARGQVSQAHSRA